MYMAMCVAEVYVMYMTMCVAEQVIMLLISEWNRKTLQRLERPQVKHPAHTIHTLRDRFDRSLIIEQSWQG